jgi:hypothetical protein|uniref:Uncharacterized protein n=1 Tax=viral metagenome TaxID=1070528 RepID=A0A6C0ECF6_9ZZZZ
MNSTQNTNIIINNEMILNRIDTAIDFVNSYEINSNSRLNNIININSRLNNIININSNSRLNNNIINININYLNNMNITNEDIFEDAFSQSDVNGSDESVTRNIDGSTITLLERIHSDSVHLNLRLFRTHTHRIPTVKCPTCRYSQTYTSELIPNQNFSCPICLDDNEELYVPCEQSKAHIICCSKCYESLKQLI